MFCLQDETKEVNLDDLDDDLDDLHGQDPDLIQPKDLQPVQLDSSALQADAVIATQLHSAGMKNVP